MGTVWRVRYAQPPAPQPGSDADGVARAVQAVLDHVTREMSHWSPASDLSRFNAAPAGEWMTLPEGFAHVITVALDIAVKSDGAFDPTLGRLVDLWGHGPPGPCPPPDDATLAAARASAGWRRLAWDATTRRLRQPGGAALDLSGIAKGHAVDAVADALRAAGLRHFLGEVGGELAGAGIKPNGDPWWVDLETPPDATGIAPLRVALHGLSIATSGDYVRGDHTIDPRTGRPLAGGPAAASVIASSTIAADGWATALAVAGRDRAAALATTHGLAARLLWRDGDGWREMVTPALASMLDG